MRLATVDYEGGTAAAVVRDDHICPLLTAEGEPAFADVGDLLRAGERGWRRAESADIDGAWTPLDPKRLCRPVLNPGAVVCVGLNYRTHIAEMGRELPEYPTYFTKLARALADPGAQIELPPESGSVDYEGELVVVIGRAGRRIPAASAAAHIAGYTLMNDVSMRDFQQRSPQWFAGKSWQSSTAIGPVVVSGDEFQPAGHDLKVVVNGELRQNAPLDDLLFDVTTLIADLSCLIALEPGDVLATGTPGGVGAGMSPPRFLSDGDVVEVAVDRLGVLRNRFRAG